MSVCSRADTFVPAALDPVHDSRALVQRAPRRELVISRACASPATERRLHHGAA